MDTAAESIVKNGKYKGAHWETRGEILEKLKTHGALPSSVMAEELGISSMAVRQHLQELEAAGEARSRDVSRGKGRPTKFWELTSRADRHFPDRHRDLALDLLGAIGEAVGPEGMDRLLEKRGESLVARYRERVAAANSLGDQVKALADARSEEGYMAEVERVEEGVWLLVENHCPVCDAAERCAGLCATELTVFQETLGSEASVERVEHLLAGSRRCVYRIARTG